MVIKGPLFESVVKIIRNSSEDYKYTSYSLE
jgi:hypothetical protein